VASSDRRVMGSRVSGWGLNLLGIVTVLVMGIAGIAAVVAW
jgi:hypothetical protein